MKELRQDVRELCERRLVRHIISRHLEGHAGPIRMTRTVRNVTVDVTTEPIVNKHLVNVDSNEESSTEAFPSDSKDNSDTPLDKIVRKLRCASYPSEVLLLITPSSKHLNQYKLHVIDRVYKNHLGMTSITKKELGQLKVSKAFQQFCIIMGTKYIKLKTVALNSAIIENIVNVVNGDCCGKNCCVLKPTQKLRNSSKPCLVATKYRQPRDKKIVSIIDDYNERNLLNNPRITELIDKINTATRPNIRDLQKFFDLAERYKFNIYIRPELCWKNNSETDLQCDMPRFNVECFLLRNRYLGAITVESDQLLQQLQKHPNMLTHIKIINDVCEMTPIPRTVIFCLRKLCNWFGMEIFYDAFGEYMYDKCKQYA